MQQPSNLKKGDTILIIGTARARDKSAITPAINELKKWGLKVELGKNIFKKHHQFAGTDEERIQDLQWALDHAIAKAVLIAGGGYGTLRIIDAICLKEFKNNPKWVIGYSDITVLHSRLLSYKFQCIHGVLAFQFSKNKTATDSLQNLLFGKELDYKLKINSNNKIGSAEGELVGGNLSILYALAGSEDELKTKHKILFIEDIDEQLYHLDRMMIQLKRSGKLKKLNGLIVGGMSDMKDNAIPFGKTANEIILDAVKEYDYPVCFDFPAGHIDQNMAICLGKKVVLNVQKKSIQFNYKADDL